MMPDYERAAAAAAETLVKYGVSSAPVSALPILKKIPDVFVVSFEKLSNDLGQDRRCVISSFGDHNQDAFTSVSVHDDKKQYLVTYNQLLSANLVQRALARELGHIVLGHDGSRPESVRLEEAKCFANHFLAPRALIHSIQASGLRLTDELFGNLTGCYHYCLSCMRRLPPVHVPAELNQKVRDQFMPYVLNLFEYQRYAQHKDLSALADLGSYMEGYEE